MKKKVGEKIIKKRDKEKKMIRKKMILPLEAM
jgi:hypothetical protein